MPLSSRKRTFKRPRARKIKQKTFAQEIKIKEIKNDIEFSNFFEQLLEKTEKFILKSAHKVEETLNKPEPDNSKSKNFELELIENNTPHHLIRIIESLSIYSDSELEGNSKNLVSNKDQTSNIEIITLSSDSGSERCGELDRAIIRQGVRLF